MRNPFRSVTGKIPPFARNPFFIATMVFIGWLLFFDRNDIFSQYRLRKELSNMTEERNFFREEIRRDSVRLNELMSNPESLEKFARETYLMKRDNEEIFVAVPPTGKAEQTD